MNPSCPIHLHLWADLHAFARFHQIPVAQFARLVEQITTAYFKSQGIKQRPIPAKPPAQGSLFS